MNLFAVCADAINAQTIESKLKFLDLLKTHRERFFQTSLPHDLNPAIQLQAPSYAGFCKVVHPTKIRRPKHIKSIESLAKLLHSITHIEYSAIDLALDAIYRFRKLPTAYYEDWLEVALQEGSHFELLRNALNKLGYEYGDFEVHTQLFDASKATPNLNERMALLHRGLEASGLDSNPFVVKKIKAFDHYLQKPLLQIFERILNDEIDHVRKGDRWWRFVCQNASPQSYIELLKRFQAFRPNTKILNFDARLQAGFSLDELMLLAQN